MGKLFSSLTAQFQHFYRNLPPTKRVSVISAGVILFAAVAIIAVMLTGQDYAVLLKNVSPEQLPVVVQKLQKKSIPFRLQEDGRVVTVPSELLYSTQLAIMAEFGDSQVGDIGLELFEKQDFGVTSYAQRINYQRALQGELMRAINSLSSIKQSKVILALPAKKTFLEESGKPTASVVIDLYPGKTLTSEQVRGITSLVASSVENLSQEDVNVVDARGKVLSKNYNPEAAASAELLDLKSKVERKLEERIEALLSKVVGTGKVIAKVEARLNPQATNTLQEIVDPDSTAVRSSVTEEEILDGARTNPAGIPGARANLPGADDQGEVGFRQNVRKELTQTNYAVPKTVRKIKEAAGALKTVSVAVLVDGVVQQVTGDGGEVSQQWTERSAEEMAKYENIIKNAIGFNAARGDSVSIENIQFQTEDFEDSQQLLDTLDRRKLLRYLFKWSLLGFALALFFFVVVRPFMRWITDSFQDSVDDMLPRTIEELEELQSVDNTLPGMSGALPVLEESLDPDKAESELLKERIMALMDDDEEKATGAFSLWLSRRDM